MTNNGPNAKAAVAYALLLACAVIFVFSMAYGYNRFNLDYQKAASAQARPLPRRSQNALQPAGEILPRAVRFTLAAPGAKQVFLHADFNLWGAHETALESGPGGVFTKTIVLPQGEYKYYSSVDGRYTPDPQAANSLFYRGQEVSLKTVL